MLVEVTVGALPDMITFTPDCSTILTANEGEAGQDADGLFVNPEGSVSIISVEAALAGEARATASSLHPPVRMLHTLRAVSAADHLPLACMFTVSSRGSAQSYSYRNHQPPSVADAWSACVRRVV